MRDLDFIKIIKRLEDKVKTLEQNQELRNISIPTDGKLVVPSYASDPAGGDSTNGQIYYNSATNKFRGYENGSWANLI